MITLFRRIRQKLIDSGSVTKYLLYAVGEILLVVVGILIALQVNNWNEENKERVIEQQLLEQLHTDLNGALSDIEFNISFINESIRSSDILIEHMDSGKPYHDSVGVHISKVFSWSRLVVDLAGYETMKSEGIDIISNDELKNQLVNTFEGRLYFHKEIEKFTMDRSEYIINMEGAKYFKSMNKGFGPKDGTIYLGISEPLNYEVLRNDSSFRYHVITNRSMVSGFQQFGNLGYRDRLINLIKEIENELKIF